MCLMPPPLVCCMQLALYRALMTVELRRAYDQSGIVRDYFDKIEKDLLLPTEPTFRTLDAASPKRASTAAGGGGGSETGTL